MLFAKMSNKYEIFFVFTHDFIYLDVSSFTELTRMKSREIRSEVTSPSKTNSKLKFNF